MRALILATLVATGVATVALAAGQNRGIIVPLPKPEAPRVTPPPAPAPSPAPVVVQPPAAPPPAVVEAPWPDNVPKLKPGTGGTAVASTKPAAPPASGKPLTPGAASATTAGTAQTTTQTQTAALPPAAIPTGPPTKVTLQASVMQGAKALKDPLIWTVSLPLPGTLNRPGQQMAADHGPKAEFNLPPATYVVTVKDAEAVVNTLLIVGSEPIAKTIPINIAVVGLRMIPYTGAKLIKQPIHWEVFNSALGPPSPQSKIADVVAPSTTFTLAAGYYVVRSQYSDINADLAILVEAGVTYSYTVDLYAANVVAKAVGASGKTPAGAIKWEVIRTAADAAGKHQVVATDTGPSPDFLLREGNYMVIATAADGSTGETPIAVRAGQTHKITVKLKPATKPATSG